MSFFGGTVFTMLYSCWVAGYDVPDTLQSAV